MTDLFFFSGASAVLVSVLGLAKAAGAPSPKQDDLPAELAAPGPRRCRHRRRRSNSFDSSSSDGEELDYCLVDAAQIHDAALADRGFQLVF
jgi:hypothetical protein